MNYWLMKTEPETYSWDDLVSQEEGTWDGVRNFAARGHLKAMKKGDLAFFYHSGEQRAIVGVCKVTKEAFPDPTAKEGNWVAVKVKPISKFKTPVTLGVLKNDALLKNMKMVKIGRLSVSPVTEKEYAKILKLSGK